MSRASWALAVALAVTAWPDHDVTARPGPAGAAGSTQNSFTRLFTAYAAGDTTIVNRMLRRDVDFLDIRQDFEASLGQWHDWQFVQAGFVFEVVLAIVERDMPSMPHVVSQAQIFITGRTDAIGVDARRDAFELLWHRTMLALLQGARQPSVADRYVHALLSRVAATPAAGDPPHLIDPRFALEHAIIAEQFTMPDMLAFATRSAWVPLAIAPVQGVQQQRADNALRDLDLALQIPATAIEASVRKAFLLHRLGRQEEALTLLDDASKKTTDRVLLYWIDLMRGRTLQALSRLDAAAETYEHALQLSPNAQSPAVAMSVLSLLRGRGEEARRWAATAQSRPADATDPWWQYWLGDFRFISDWLGLLRRTARAGA